jgi:hypothetical protein
MNKAAWWLRNQAIVDDKCGFLRRYAPHSIAIPLAAAVAALVQRAIREQA